MTTLEDELNHCLVIFEVMGLQYFSLKRLSCDGLKDHKRLHRFLYMVFLLAFINSISVFYIVKDIPLVQGDVTAKNVLMFAIQNSINVGMVLVAVVSLIQSYSKTRIDKKMFLNTKEMTMISNKEFNTCIDFKKIRKSAFRKISKFLVFFVTTQATVMIYDAQFFIYMIGVLPVLFLLMVVLKFSFHVDFMVNCQLEELGSRSREILEKFYYQLNLQPVKFSALGFYTINQALLASIVTGVVSYQIILVQFHTS